MARGGCVCLSELAMFTIAGDARFLPETPLAAEQRSLSPPLSITFPRLRRDRNQNRDVKVSYVLTKFGNGLD